MTTFSLDLLTGIAQALETAGLGTYRDDGSPYDASETAIVFKVMPQETDRVIALTAYPISDDAGRPFGQTGVQFHMRGLIDPFDVDLIGDAIFDLFQSAADRQFGSVHVTQFLRRTSLPMGQDSNRRWERIDNYYADHELPVSANRTA